MKVFKWEKYTLEFPEVMTRSHAEGTNTTLKAFIENGQLLSFNGSLPMKTADECRNYARVLEEIAGRLDGEAEINNPDLDGPPF